MKKEKVFSIALIVAQNFLHLMQNLIVELAGLLLPSHYLGHLKLKLIILLEWKEWSITAQNAGCIMDMYLMMGLKQLKKDFATMDYVFFLK